MEFASERSPTGRAFVSFIHRFMAHLITYFSSITSRSVFIQLSFPLLRPFEAVPEIITRYNDGEGLEKLRSVYASLLTRMYIHTHVVVTSHAYA